MTVGHLSVQNMVLKKNAVRFAGLAFAGLTFKIIEVVILIGFYSISAC